MAVDGAFRRNASPVFIRDRAISPPLPEHELDVFARKRMTDKFRSVLEDVDEHHPARPFVLQDPPHAIWIGRNVASMPPNRLKPLTASAAKTYCISFLDDFHASDVPFKFLSNIPYAFFFFGGERGWRARAC